MKPNYTLLSCVCIALSVPLAILFLQRRSARAAVPVVRFATYNAALNRGEPGALLAELETGTSAAATAIAAVVQRTQVDVLLLNELDRDDGERAARVFADRYLAVSQHGQAPIEFPFVYFAPVNTGEPSGIDLDGDGSTNGPADAFGFGRFPGQYGMAVLSRHPILADGVRTFRTLRWSAMPDALRPAGVGDAVWQQLRLSSKSHWDVPVGIGKRVVHLLCSHPTPPVFDGPEDRNGCRNHDEIRFWVDYLTPDRAAWIVDDDGARGGLPAGEAFVVLGDLNCDPHDGDARRAALVALLAHARVQDPTPGSAGGDEAHKRQWGRNATHGGPPAQDTGDFPDAPGDGQGSGPGNLRVDYVLPSRELTVAAAGVFWPLAHEPAARLAEASDHRLVWVDVEAR
jgi:endonuclease/exonuclease/phosphatase family metal-dependent hydrolase